MANVETGKVGLATSAYIYMDPIPDAPLVGVAGGTVKIPATSGGSEHDKIIIVKSVAPTGSGLPAGIAKRDIYIHRGAEVTLADGDEVYVCSKNDSYPATNVKGDIEKETIDDISTQKDRGVKVSVDTGVINFPVTISGFREKGNELQDRIAGSSVKTITTSTDGSVIVKDAAPAKFIVALMYWDGQTDIDEGVLAVVKPSSIPNNWSKGGAQEYEITLNVDSLATPTRVKVAAL